MENKKFDDALKKMDSMIAEKEASILEFKEGGRDLQFQQVLSLGYDYVEIAEGVLVKIERKVSETYFVLRCKMKDKAELLLHLHSDYDERFKLLTGSVFDKHSNTLITKSHTFAMGVWHNLVSVGDSEMLIYCTKS